MTGQSTKIRVFGQTKTDLVGHLSEQRHVWPCCAIIRAQSLEMNLCLHKLHQRLIKVCIVQTHDQSCCFFLFCALQGGPTLIFRGSD